MTNLAQPSSPRSIALLVLHAGATDLGECAIPLWHALTLRALEAEVELYFAGRAVRLLADDIAGCVKGGTPPRSLASMLDEAHADGVRIHVCASAWKAHVRPDAMLTPRCAGFAGAATYLARAIDPQWRVLTY